MTDKNKYLDFIQYMELNKEYTINDVSNHISEKFPELIEKSNRLALNHKKDTTGLRQLNSKISHSYKNYAENIVIYKKPCNRYNTIKRISSQEVHKNIKNEIKEEEKSLKRSDIENIAISQMSDYDLYRIKEFKDISRELSKICKINFEVDHSKALLNKDNPGNHNPDNFQILTKPHNSNKSNKNWKRFSFKEQTKYLKKILNIEKFLNKFRDSNTDLDTFEILIKRLELIY